MNLLCGSVAVYIASIIVAPPRLNWIGHWSDVGEITCYLIMAGAVFDFFDGLVARALNVSSPIGKELDSLADLVTFGLAPTFITIALINLSMPTITEQSKLFMFQGVLGSHMYLILPSIALSIVAGSALRLAKFNIDTEQSSTFKGLPTPASAMFFIGLLFFYAEYQATLEQYAATPFVLAGIALSIAILMNVNLPMFSFKLKSNSWNGNELQIVFLVISSIILIIFQLAGLSLCILLYIVLSIIQKLMSK